jgi:hypothetical protein
MENHDRHYFESASLFVKISVNGSVTQLFSDQILIKDGGSTIHYTLKNQEPNIAERICDLTLSKSIFFRFFENDTTNRIFHATCDDFFQKFASHDPKASENRNHFVLDNYDKINQVATRFTTFLNNYVLRIISGDCYFVFGYDNTHQNKITFCKFNQMLRESEIYHCNCIDRVLKLNKETLVNLLKAISSPELLSQGEGEEGEEGEEEEGEKEEHSNLCEKKEEKEKKQKKWSDYYEEEEEKGEHLNLCEKKEEKEKKQNKWSDYYEEEEEEQNKPSKKNLIKNRIHYFFDMKCIFGDTDCMCCV